MIDTRELRQHENLREQAVVRLRKKHDFAAHLLAFAMVNAMLVLVWWLTEVAFFWPIFPLMGWGIGLGFHAWDNFGRPPTEERIHREIVRLRRE